MKHLVRVSRAKPIPRPAFAPLFPTGLGATLFQFLMSLKSAASAKGMTITLPG